MVLGVKVSKAVCVAVQNMCTHSIVHGEEDDNRSSSNSGSARNLKSIKFRTIQIIGLEQMISLFAKMAELELVKGKELTTMTVATHFNRLTWRHLVGLESLSVLLGNSSVLLNLAAIDGGLSLTAALEVMVRLQSNCLVYDYKHAQQIICNHADE
jgi:hypothetical protein